MLKTMWPVALGVLAVVVMVAVLIFVPPDEPPAVDEAVLDAHKVAEATLAAHYIAAAVDAGKSTDEINAALRQIASQTIIDELWASDGNGVAVFTSVPGGEFSYGMDPDADRQAAPFVNLILGRQKTVVQEAQPRDSDGARFQYVGVAGVDSPRIVQVGFRGE